MTVQLESVIPKELLGLLIDQNDSSRGVDNQDGVRGGLEETAKLRV